MTFEQKLADFLTAAAAMSESPLVRFLVALALIVGAVRLIARIGRSDRGTTTYWYDDQQITRHDYAAIKAADVPDDECGDPVGAVCRARLAPFFSAWDERVER